MLFIGSSVSITFVTFVSPGVSPAPATFFILFFLLLFLFLMFYLSCCNAAIFPCGSIKGPAPSTTASDFCAGVICLLSHTAKGVTFPDTAFPKCPYDFLNYFM